MPRIAATLGVFGLVVGALALNMAQFPIDCGVLALPPAAEGLSEKGDRRPVSGHEPQQAEASPGFRTGPESDEAVPAPDAAKSPAVALRPTEPAPPRSEPEPHESEEPPERIGTEPAETPAADSQTAASEGPEADARCCGANASASGVPGCTLAGSEPPPTYAAPPATGVYNPLEPQPEAAPARPGWPPSELAASGTPTEAAAGPPYAASGPLPETPGRDTAPAGPGAAPAASSPNPANGVVRLPPVDNAWPSVITDQPPGQTWRPATGE